MRTILSLLFLLMVGLPAWAQNPNNHWQLGNQDINFTTITPTATTVSAAAGKYGLATISDSSGNLLFYTDGQTVWNKNHAIMTNGSGLGDPVENVIIVPHPGNANQYYIFRSMNRLCLCFYLDVTLYAYSLVEFNASNPLGTLVNINASPGLYPETNYTKILNETGSTPIGNTLYYGPLVATRDKDATAYWVVAQSANKILSYKVDASGLNATPVVSTFTNAQIYGYGSYNSSTGVISGRQGANFRITDDNSRLVGLQYSKGSYSGNDDPDDDVAVTNNQFYQLTFNPNTGAFSSYVSILSDALVSGFELSPDSNKLYYIRTPKPNSSITWSKGEVVVKDLTNLSNPSRTLDLTSTTTPSSMFSFLQKDKYGNIRVSSIRTELNRNKYLHLIVNPNSYSSSTVTADVLSLNTYSIGRMPQLILNVSSCQAIVAVTAAVTSGTDTKQASQTISASNAISSGATAIYHASTSVVLTNGFHSANGSKFRGYIEGCTGNYVGRHAYPEEVAEEPKPEEPKSQLDLAFYPNPTSGLLEIKTKSLKMASVSISNMMDSRLVGKFNVKQSDTFTTDISHLNKGLYLVTVETSDGKVLTGKVIKQ